MRKEKELVHRLGQQRQSTLRLQAALDAPEVRTPRYLKDWFTPRRETRLMSDETQRTNGLFLPYPLLGIMLTLVLALGGGIIGLYVKVDTMGAVMLMRDTDHREQVKDLKNKLELQELYIHDIREMLAADGRLKKKGSN